MENKPEHCRVCGNNIPNDVSTCEEAGFGEDCGKKLDTPQPPEEKCCSECFVPSHDESRGHVTVAVPDSCRDEDCDCHPTPTKESRLELAYIKYQEMWNGGQFNWNEKKKQGVINPQRIWNVFIEPTLTTEIQKAREEVVSHIGLKEGWEETEDIYRKHFNLPQKYSHSDKLNDKV